MNRIASPLRPARPVPADAMHVGFAVVGRIVVHHVADALDVETARRHIGGDDDVDIAGTSAVRWCARAAIAECRR